VTRPRIDQLVAGFADGDAISREARELRKVLRGLGYESDIFAPSASIGTAVKGDCRVLDHYAAGPRDVAIYHYSTASAASALFLASAGRKVVRYHNITPESFFRGYDDDLADELAAARRGLPAIVAAADVAWADSDYNAREIRGMGARAVEVVPLFFSPGDFGGMADPAMLARLGGGFTNLLFVGRMAPNKAVEELVLAFAWYHRTIDARSRLVLVGSDRSCPRYFAMLRLLASRLGLANVCFEGFLSDAQLAACYRSASAFVCASRHEGYCLPLLEAMSFGVPVIAREAGGMPEAMGGAGVLFDGLDARELAELVRRVTTDAVLHEEVLQSQRQRIEAVQARDLAGDCARLLGPLGA
jgi:glycosyltransferase involved in cell wall biosynthesis